jgi:nitroreductase
MAHTPISAQTLTDALHWRYAVKKFDPTRKIPDATWEALESALVLSPSTFGLQPWKFVVVRDRATLERLAGAAHGQTQPLECSHFVVFAARMGLASTDVDHYIERISKVRGVPVEKLQGYADVMKSSAEHARAAGTLDGWMARQVYIALGGFLTAAALLGVDGSPMEGIDAKKFDEILGLPAKGYGALCACAVGYRSADDRYASLPKVRYDAKEVVTHI